MYVFVSMTMRKVWICICKWRSKEQYKFIRAAAGLQETHKLVHTFD